MKNNQKGFTLIEIIMVIVVLAILTLIAIAVFSGTQATASTKSCQANRYIILRAYHQYVINDPALTLNDLLENENNKYFSNEVKCPDGGTYSVVDDAITCSIHGNSFIDVSTSASYKYSFSNMSEDEINALLDLVIMQSNDKWVVSEKNGKVVLTNQTTGENRIFFPVEFENYMIKSNIQLSGSNGYGIMIDTISDDNANDTGYIFQMDAAFGGGEFVFRERTNGKESSPFERIKPADVIPGYDKKTFWNEKHEVIVDIVSYSSTQNEMKVYIDGYEITINDTVLIDKTDTSEQTYIGFRTWGSSSVLIDDLEVLSN
ncbi:MAG: prepilin-type N-terminal cleavage/methylation domain-containing protein [Clostridia bacterium]|nr:prepilin-type N-terminal cleavage/methylation domain-containing protein [Clostridia bacterium]